MAEDFENKDKEEAWFRVFDLCLELGMNTDNFDSGVNNVLDFISELAKNSKVQ